MKTLSPGLHKFIKHREHIDKMLRGEVVAPIHVSVWPTIRCQLNCEYCCCRKQKTITPDLDLNLYKEAINILARYGTKAIEFSGGGEPLLWKDFSEAVEHTYSKGLKISLITNGIAIDKIPDGILNKITWLRISFQSIDHANSINYYKLMASRYTGSVIVSPRDFSYKLINDWYSFAKSHGIKVRIASQRPSRATFDKILCKEVEKYGSPLFFSEKETGRPLACYMAWIRAAIDWQGHFLPCPAIQLNEENAGFIPESFRLCHISNLEKWLKDNPPHDLGFRCKYCNCGKEHNDFMANLIGEMDDVDFV